jgi:hypothetical protein
MGVVEGRPVVRAKLVDFVLVVGVAVLVLLSVGTGLLADLSDGLGTTIALALLDRDLAAPVPLRPGCRTAIAGRARGRGRDRGHPPRHLPGLGPRLRTDDRLERGLRLPGDPLMVFLYSVYLYAGALLLGAAVASEWSLPHEPSGTTVRERVRRLLVRRR